MRIFLAGGSGVIGSRLIPALTAVGHQVTATTRRVETTDRLVELGADSVVVDVYDAAGLTAAVAAAAPDVIVHQLTDLSDYDTDANARLRREGTANLVNAARAAGVERMITQSIAWAYETSGDPAVTTSGDPAREDTPIPEGSAVGIMEDLVFSMPHGTVLRYGMLYGPTTWYEPGGRIADAVVAGSYPASPAVTSFVHLDDVVAATVQALDWPDGAYNIVDDEPAPATTWLPVFAAGLGAPEPAVVALPEGTQAGTGASNAKARTTGWTPIHPTWRDSFAGRRP